MLIEFTRKFDYISFESNRVLIRFQLVSTGIPIKFPLIKPVF